MDEAVGYRERRSTLLPAVLWRRRCEPGESTVLPDGCMDLIHDGTTIRVAGPDTRPHVHRTDRPTTLGAIRFAPGVAPIVLGLPASEFRDDRVDLAALVDPRVRRWIDDAAAAPDPVLALETLAARELRAAGGPVSWTGATIAELRHGATVDAVAADLGLTTRQLHRRCLHHFGYGPKMLQRILRVRDALPALRQDTVLSDSAHLHGFADYPHMVREFRAITGSTPREIARPRA
ncbi:AraC family transcriptional regulator [uncultured Williamsia sp.]|uniref:helix-turn-helix domain-containing protein n=1 Tax=uncultured Williamsia sp. TaxID=259311 RepID=UPI00262376F6|nr:helix-turn-helix domain-containing protein [uncultured Williamsia sp.]